MTTRLILGGAILNPYKVGMGQKVETDAGSSEDRAFLAHIEISEPAVAAADGALSAVTDNGSEQEITTGITDPDVPRCVTATAGGTEADIKAIQVTIEGTNYADEEISEDLPAFTENSAGIVTGSKAFKTITKVTIPAHDGTGATTAIGFGDKLGLPYKLERDTVLKTYLDDTEEGTASTVATSATAIESNTIDLNSALDGNDVDIYLMV